MSDLDDDGGGGGGGVTGGQQQQHQLSLLRCLSETAISTDPADAISATVLRSFSDTCLASNDDEEEHLKGDSSRILQILEDQYLQPALIATNVDEDDDEDEDVVEAVDFRCNCGCGVALKTTPVDAPDSEDEGCYLGGKKQKGGEEEGDQGRDSPIVKHYS
jgi:hypothetical protein